MAKNIVTTPGEGKEEYTGADAGTLRLEVLDDGSLAIIGASGTIIKITDTLTGIIFSIADAGGVPLFEVDASVPKTTIAGTLIADYNEPIEEVYFTEFPNSSIVVPASANDGQFETDVYTTLNLCYYRFTANVADQSGEIWVFWRVPDDFVSWDPDEAIQWVVRTLTTSVSDASINCTIYEGSTSRHADGAQASSSAAVWKTVTVTGTEGTMEDFVPGDIVGLKFIFTCDDGTDYADLRELTFKYLKNTSIQ